MSKMTFAGKRAFVTGAASGIGRATALRLAGLGAELYLTDRNAHGLAQTVDDVRALGAQVPEHRALDIANYDEVTAFAEQIHAHHPSMDLVMNIAGVSAWGTVDRLSHEQWDKMISINLMGPIHVIENFLPPMVAARNGGHLVNVSSAAGLIGLPWHAAYSASKFGLRGLSEVLRFDLARYRIGVSVVVPGAVRTPLVDTVEIAGVDRNDPQVSRWVDRFSGHAVSPEKAADKILAGIAKNRFLIYTSSDIRALYAFKRVAWWPYSVAMRQVNLVFTRTLKPAPVLPRASAVPVEPRAVAPDGPARTGPAPAAPPRQ
jgi:NAD(P)-dependent dehydrogenase (short-subunit alcohol dehydrogenase family)